MAIYEIPLKPTPQLLKIALAGTTYSLRVDWNLAAACWMLDIRQADETPIVEGIPLVTGVDLLEQYGYLNFGGRLFAQTDGDINQPPTFSDLGTLGHLYFEVVE